jgi:hypothetical protein
MYTRHLVLFNLLKLLKSNKVILYPIFVFSFMVTRQNLHSYHCQSNALDIESRKKAPQPQFFSVSLLFSAGLVVEMLSTKSFMYYNIMFFDYFPNVTKSTTNVLPSSSATYFLGLKCYLATYVGCTL